MNINNRYRNKKKHSHSGRKALAFVLLAALAFNMLYCPMFTYAAGSENIEFQPEKSQESALSETAEAPELNELDGYTDQLEDLLIQYSDLDAQTTRLIVEGTGLPELNDLSRVEKEDCYTILQFETAEDADSAKLQLEQAGYQVFYDEKIKTVYDTLPGYTDYLCKSADLMNMEDLTALTAQENAAQSSGSEMQETEAQDNSAETQETAAQASATDPQSSDKTPSSVIVGVLDSGVSAGIMSSRVLTGYNAYEVAEEETARNDEETGTSAASANNSAADESADNKSESSSDTDNSQPADNKSESSSDTDNSQPADNKSESSSDTDNSQPADNESASSTDTGHTNTEDKKNHGTKVASIILDMTSDNVSVLPIKVTNDSGSSTVLSVELGIMYAAEHCDVINMSLSYLGTDAYLKDFWNTSIDYAISKGVPVVVSAGNTGRDTKYSYPSCYEPCFTIGALADEDTIASFSCHGTVDFAAPGKNVKCIDNSGSVVSCNGTSFSAPAISALAAELISVRQMYYADCYTVEELHDVIKNMCTDLGDSGYDAYYGYGLPTAPHAYLTDDYEWTQDPEGCKLTLTCVNHPEESAQYEGTISSETVEAPTCEITGTGKETAEFTVQDALGLLPETIYRSCRNYEIPATGRDYETVIVKANPKTDGCILTQCKNCEAVSENTVIPRPAKVTLSAYTFICNGQSRKPSVTVKDSEGNIISAEHYTVTYENDMSSAVGQYGIEVNFTGDYYEGTVNKSYTITSAPQEILKNAAQKLRVKTKLLKLKASLKKICKKICKNLCKNGKFKITIYFKGKPLKMYVKIKTAHKTKILKMAI